MVDQPDTLGVWLRRRRRSLELTQAELAARAGCVLTTIKKIETGARLPSRQLAARLADALALSDAERGWLLGQLRGASGHSIAGAQAASLPPPGPLIGRSRDLSALHELLTAPAVRLVTLTGPGGVGKTRLALQLAATLCDAFVDGVCFVDLAQLHDPALLPLTIARALRLAPSGSPLEALRRALGLRSMLLVLDNLEHLLAAAPAIAALVAAAPNVTILATSRAPLHIAAERVYALAPLDLPPPAGAHALDTYGAVQLFVYCAQASQQGFALTPDLGPVVAQICQRVDGLPLAIELAAAWIHVLPPRALLRRLDRRLDLLVEGRRDLPARQRSLQATLDWSLQLLRPRTQRLFARMGVFAGGATLEALEQVCRDAEREALLPEVRSLVDQNCLRQSSDASGEPRFRMLETVREYALDRLDAAGGRDELHARHAHYYLALAEAAVPQLRGADQPRWLDLLEAEHDNMRAALRWLLASGRQQEALRLGGALHWFWDRRGYLEEGRTSIERALRAAEAAPTGAPARTAARGWALVGAAALAFDQGDWPAAATWAEAACELFQPLDDHAGLTLALLRLAFVRGMAGPSGAASLLTAARSHAAATGDPWFVGLAHFVSAQAALFAANDLAAARAHLASAAPALRTSGDPYLIAHSLGTSASLAMAEGSFEAARADIEEALTTARSLGDTRSVALMAATAADVARCRGAYDRAAELYSESLALYHELGNDAEIPAILHNQAYVALAQGEVTAAHELFAQSLRRQHERGNTGGVAEGLAGLAAVAAAEGSLARSARLFGAAEAVRARHAGPVWPAEQLEVARQVAALRLRLPAAALAEHWRAGAGLEVAQAVAEALVPGATPPRPAKLRARGGLTPREHEVAVLVARGASNRAIAEALVVSERTAEHHVANILAKLDFSSRAQIAAWVVAGA